LQKEVKDQEVKDKIAAGALEDSEAKYVSSLPHYFHYAIFSQVLAYDI